MAAYEMEEFMMLRNEQQKLQQETAFQPKTFDQKMRGSKHEQLDAIISGGKYKPNKMTWKQKRAVKKYAKNLKPSQVFETNPRNKPTSLNTRQNIKVQKLRTKQRWYNKLFRRGKQAHSEDQFIELSQRQPPSRIIPSSIDNLQVRDTQFQGPGYGERYARITDSQGIQREVLYRDESYTPSAHPFDIPPDPPTSWTKNPEGVRMSQLEEPPDEPSLPPLLPKQNKNIMDAPVPAGQQEPIVPRPTALPRTKRVIDHTPTGIPVLEDMKNPIRLNIEDSYDAYDPNLFSSALQTGSLESGSLDSDVFYTPPSSLQQTSDQVQQFEADNPLARFREEANKWQQENDDSLLAAQLAEDEERPALAALRQDNQREPVRPNPPIRLNPEEESIVKRKKQIPYHEYPTPKPRTFSGPNYGGKRVTFNDNPTVQEYTPESSITPPRPLPRKRPQPMDTTPPQKGPRPLPRRSKTQRNIDDKVNTNLTTRRTEESLQDEEPMETGIVENPPFKKPKLSWMVPDMSRKDWIMLGGVSAAAIGGASLLSMFDHKREHKYF